MTFEMHNCCCVVIPEKSARFGSNARGITDPSMMSSRTDRFRPVVGPPGRRNQSTDGHVKVLARATQWRYPVKEIQHPAPAAGNRRAGVLITLAALVLAFASACNPGASPSGSGAVTPLATTGVRGVVLAGPTCPVERAGESSCVRAVSGAIILAVDPSGREAGRAVSDASGAYFLRLSPGTYEIVPQPVHGLMGVAAKTSVTVPNGTPIQLDLEYDTGIR
jgi:hypothetical protein